MGSSYLYQVLSFCFSFVRVVPRSFVSTRVNKFLTILTLSQVSLALFNVPIRVALRVVPYSLHHPRTLPLARRHGQRAHVRRV